MEDEGDLFEYAGNPNVGPNAGWPEHKHIGQSRQALRGYIKDGEAWAIELEGKLIGSVGLHRDRLWSFGANNVRMLGYVLSENYWGGGYATEAARRVVRYAFEEAGLALLTVYHYSYNAASGRVAEKCGFIYDGALRDAATLSDGNITDEICYSMTHRDYLAAIKGWGAQDSMAGAMPGI